MTAAPKPRGGPGSLFLFDGYNFAFRAYHALPMLNAPDGTPVNAVHGYCRMVQAVRREFMPQYVLAVFDAGGDGGRKELYPEYKAHRPPAPEDLRPQFPLIRQATDALGIPRIEDPRFEADDLIASYAKAAHAQGLRVVIVSSDKDLMQMVVGDEGGEPSILLWDTMKNRGVGPAQVVEKFGVGPTRLGDLLALCGDSADNVPGVPGIGPKTAAALLTEFGDLEGVLAAAPGLKQKARRQKLLEHAESARLSRRLVELHADVPLPVPIAELADPGADEAEVAGFFEPLGFRQVVRELGATARSANGASATGNLAATDAPQGAVTLGRVADFTPKPERIRVLGPEGEGHLDKFVAAWMQAPFVALEVLAAGEDALTATIVGIALATPETEVVYLPLGHRQGDLVGTGGWSTAALVPHLRTVLGAEGPGKIVHDHKRCGHLLRRIGLALGHVVSDPMLVSYTLDPARSEHSLAALAKDVLGHDLPTVEQLTGKGRKKLAIEDVSVESAAVWLGTRVEALEALRAPLEGFLQQSGPQGRHLLDEVEMPLAWVLGQMEPRGICVDVAALARQSVDLGHSIAALQKRVDEQAGHPVNIDSPIQLQKLLFEERGLPSTRKTKTGHTTDAKALEELSLLDPIALDILEYRSLTKLKGTYLDTLPTLVDPSTGRLHTSFHQAVAATGRLSSSDPNLQNIPIRTAEGRRIREAFVAGPGRKLVALDYSQIELRILAHLSGDPNLVSAFIEGVDVHRRTAAEVFEVEESAVTDEQRRIAKAVNFGVVYGQTQFGLARQLGIPRGKAGSYIRAYFEKVPGVDRYMRQLVTVAAGRGYAETILGRRRRIPELAARGTARGYGERIARNTPIQGSAADILKLAMIEVERALTGASWAQMLLTVHDELIFECEIDRVDELINLARPKMECAVELKVPLQVDAGVGDTWAACKG